MSSLGKNITSNNVYKKISNIEKAPFWGLTKNRIEQLFEQKEDLNKDFYIRLDSLNGSITLNSDQVAELLKDKQPASDGDYKILKKDLEKFFVI